MGKAVHVAQYEDQELKRAHWMDVQDREVRKVRRQSDAEISLRLVELETKVRHYLWNISIQIPNEVRGQASHTGRDASKVMNRHLQDPITRLGDPLAVRAGGVCTYTV